MRQLKTGARNQGWSEDEELTILFQPLISTLYYISSSVRDVVVC